MGIEIICPLYKAEQYIISLDESIKKQQNVTIDKITYILTKTNDNSEEILKKINANYNTIEPSEFSHSLTREKFAMQSNSDILVFITQDIEIKNNDWLEKLVQPIILGESQASFSRQLTKFDNIEKYTREKNYPDYSYISDINYLNKVGMRAFFFSDASSAIKTEIFKKLNGYDGKNLPTNEDQYIAYKLITNNYKIKYCSDSIVYHSHNFTLKELYKRYYDTGRFFKQEKFLDNYGTTKTGSGLAKYILINAIKEKNIKVLTRFLPDMIVRYCGMIIGKWKG